MGHEEKQQMIRLILTFFLVFNVGFGQNLADLIPKEFEANFTKDICRCVDEKEDSLKEDFRLEALFGCFEESFSNFHSELETFVFKNLDTLKTSTEEAYEMGSEYGSKILGKIQNKLVFQCDSYYRTLEILSHEMAKNISKGTSTEAIDSLSHLIKNEPTNKFLLWQRGAYYIGEKDYKSAQSDFETSIAQDSTFMPAQFFLAYSFQLQGDYKKAIEQYEILDNSVDLPPEISTVAKMYLAYVRRKLDEED